MAAIIQTKIGVYQVWRENLVKTITSYRDWLIQTGTNQAIQELRIYDILDMLKKDHLVMAFVAEFSRGKTETINALFFADLNLRLLPSEPGRATMCPTEILWDEREASCIKLLPIETRVNDDTLNYLKTIPNVWQKIRLNTQSPVEMRDALTELMRQKAVSQIEAKKLGLWNEQDIGMMQELINTGMVKVPVWRHAIINYPHPLLKSGLVVIDTPGLNALGAEPELTLSIIPHANAVLFLTATDTGITKSDMQIWNTYIKRSSNHKLVLLNKIDILWDEMRTTHEINAEINKQTEATAQLLGVQPEHVFAISAQKALVAKIKKDEALLKRSGIEKLELALGNSIVHSKQAIIGKTAIAECSEMVKVSRRMAQTRTTEAKALLAELKSLLGQQNDASKALLAKVIMHRKRYEASVPTFNKANAKVIFIGNKLLRHLSLTYLDKSIKQNTEAMSASWTTPGLQHAMRSITKQASELAEHIHKEGAYIKKLADNIYHVFQHKHNFEVFEPPVLNLQSFVSDIQALQKVTDDFCADPVNILTEKHFLIRKFYLVLYAETQKIFQQAFHQCQIWLNDVMSILKTQMENYKTNLEHRARTLSEALSNADVLKQEIAAADQEFNLRSKQSQALDQILLTLLKAAAMHELEPNQFNLAEKNTVIKASSLNSPILH